jgi:hypothetical protein
VTKTANAAKPAASKPEAAAKQEANAEPERKAASDNAQISGAAPTVPSGGFENRFGAWSN